MIEVQRHDAVCFECGKEPGILLPGWDRPTRCPTCAAKVFAAQKKIQENWYNLLYRMAAVKYYDASHGDYRACVCGHAYYRHFDPYEDDAPVGCKYCSCRIWELLRCECGSDQVVVNGRKDSTEENPVKCTVCGNRWDVGLPDLNSRRNV